MTLAVKVEQAPLLPPTPTNPLDYALLLLTTAGHISEDTAARAREITLQFFDGPGERTLAAEASCARDANSPLGAPASPSGSTLQPPSSASASIPSAEHIIRLAELEGGATRSRIGEQTLTVFPTDADLCDFAQAILESQYE